MLEAIKFFGIRFSHKPVALLMLMSLWLPAVVAAQDANTSTAGGTGGTAFTLSCGTKALIGIKGKGGIFVDSLQGVCVQVNRSGTWLGSPSFTSTTGGTGGTNTFDIRCPANQAVSGIQGRKASFVDQLRILCSPLGSNGRTSGAPTVVSGSAGGTGGTAFGPINCSSSKPAKALIGGSASVIDNIGLTCNFPFTFSLSARTLAVSGGNPMPMDISSQGDPAASGITFNTSATSATVPASVSLSGRPTTFQANTSPVSSTRRATVTATFGGDTQTASFDINPPSVSSLTITPQDIRPGANANAVVRLSSAAPSEGTQILLTSKNTSVATVQANFNLTNGSVSPNLAVHGNAGVVGCADVFANTNFGRSKQAPVCVFPGNPGSTVMTFTLSSNTASFSEITGTITLSQPFPASGGVTPTVVSSNTSRATVIQPSAFIPGQTTGTFKIRPVSGFDSAVVISVTFNNVTIHRSVRILSLFSG